MPSWADLFNDPGVDASVRLQYRGSSVHGSVQRALDPPTPPVALAEAIEVRSGPRNPRLFYVCSYNCTVW